MTARAGITVAVMREAIAAAAKHGLRVEVRPDGTMIVEPAKKPRDDANPFDLADMTR